MKQTISAFERNETLGLLLVHSAIYALMTVILLYSLFNTNFGDLEFGISSIKLISSFCIGTIGIVLWSPHLFCLFLGVVDPARSALYVSDEFLVYLSDQVERTPISHIQSVNVVKVFRIGYSTCIEMNLQGGGKKTFPVSFMSEDSSNILRIIRDIVKT